MNIGALLQDSPSDDRHNRRLSNNRDHDRDRDRDRDRPQQPLPHASRHYHHGQLPPPSALFGPNHGEQTQGLPPPLPGPGALHPSPSLHHPGVPALDHRPRPGPGLFMPPPPSVHPIDYHHDPRHIHPHAHPHMPKAPSLGLGVPHYPPPAPGPGVPPPPPSAQPSSQAGIYTHALNEPGPYSRTRPVTTTPLPLPGPPGPQQTRSPAMGSLQRPLSHPGAGMAFEPHPLAHQHAPGPQPPHHHPHHRPGSSSSSLPLDPMMHASHAPPRAPPNYPGPGPADRDRDMREREREKAAILGEREREQQQRREAERQQRKRERDATKKEQDRMRRHEEKEREMRERAAREMMARDRDKEMIMARERDREREREKERMAERERQLLHAMNGMMPPTGLGSKERERDRMMQGHMPGPPLSHRHQNSLEPHKLHYGPDAGKMPPNGAAYAPPPPPPVVVHLGTFVFPRTPFPCAVAAAGRETRATIVVPAGFLPARRLPGVSRIWGGGLARGDGDPVMGSGPPQAPAGDKDRRVYTDDSDLVLCCVHAGYTHWGEIRRARRRGEEMRVDVRVIGGVGKFVGGWGAGFKERRRRRRREGEREGKEGEEDEEDGRKLLSAGWGSGHDGSAIEILRAEYVKGAVRSFGLRTRSQRMKDYTERRIQLFPVMVDTDWPMLGKRKRENVRERSPTPVPERLQKRARRLPNATDLEVLGEEGEEEESGEAPTLVFAGLGEESNPRMAYSPSALRAAMFGGRPARGIVLETAGERFVAAPEGEGRWTIRLVVPRAEMERLPYAPVQAPEKEEEEGKEARVESNGAPMDQKADADPTDVDSQAKEDGTPAGTRDAPPLPALTIPPEELASLPIPREVEMKGPSVDAEESKPNGVSEVPATGEVVLPATGAPDLPATAEPLLPAIAESLLPAIAESLLPASAEPPLPATAEALLPATGGAPLPVTGGELLPVTAESSAEVLARAAGEERLRFLPEGVAVLEDAVMPDGSRRACLVEVRTWMFA